jgi:hypothetical protein
MCIYSKCKKLEKLRLCMSYMGMFNFRKCIEDNNNRMRDYSFVIFASLTTSNAVSWKQVFFPGFFI